MEELRKKASDALRREVSAYEVTQSVSAYCLLPADDLRKELKLLQRHVKTSGVVNAPLLTVIDQLAIAIAVRN